VTPWQLNKIKLRTFALFGVVVGIVVLYISIRGPSSFPDRETLAPVNGTVAWTRPDDYSVDFGIAGDPRTFSYARKSGELATVSSVLKDSAAQPIAILIAPQDPQQGFADGPFFQVYAVSSNRAPVRTLAQVRSAWASDYRYGVFAAVLLFLAAGFLERVARRAPPNNSFKPKPLRGSA
jgi:hypothetical protein